MTNYYNLKLTALLEAKFDKGLLRKFYENTELLQYSFLKKLFELLMEINQSNDIINDIGQKYKSNDNRNIISDDLEKKLNESEELLHIYNNIINYLENIPYVDNSIRVFLIGVFCCLFTCWFACLFACWFACLLAWLLALLVGLIDYAQ